MKNVRKSVVSMILVLCLLFTLAVPAFAAVDNEKNDYPFIFVHGMLGWGNRTIDWNKKETARAGMRKMVKRLLKKYHYPPEGVEDAISTVLSQCEMWTDHVA